MDRDTVVRLALECGAHPEDIANKSCQCEECNSMLPVFIRFATLVRNAALEEAVKVADHIVYDSFIAADAIRALKEQ